MPKQWAAGKWPKQLVECLSSNRKDSYCLLCCWKHCNQLMSWLEILLVLGTTYFFSFLNAPSKKWGFNFFLKMCGFIPPSQTGTYSGAPSFVQSFTIEDLLVVDLYYLTLIPLFGAPIYFSNYCCFSIHMLISLFFSIILIMQKS